VLCLPRLAVLVSIEADRPGAQFPGPLSPYQKFFTGISLSRDFERVKVPGNPMKFCYGVFRGSNSCDHYMRKKTAESRKKIAEWPEQSTKRHLSFDSTIARKPQGRALQSFFGPNFTL
jgi:hypothetical protein